MSTSSKLAYMAWSMLAAAVIGWVVVVLFEQHISALASVRDTANNQNMQDADSKAQEIHIHALARSLAPYQPQMESLVQNDIFALSQIVVNLSGKGAIFKIQSVQPTGVFASVDVPSDIHAALFHVSVDGSYDSVMQSLSRLESLKLPVEVDSADLAPTHAGQWHMDVNISVLTTAQLSS